jgi:hypothetical protein
MDGCTETRKMDEGTEVHWAVAHGNGAGVDLGNRVSCRKAGRTLEKQIQRPIHSQLRHVAASESTEAGFKSAFQITQLICVARQFWQYFIVLRGANN